MSDIAIIMGSDSDWPIMEEAAKVLDKFSISYSAQVLSAHRMPVEMVEFAKNAQSAGYKVIIAGAGGAAHLPGMVASLTTLPVIGVPVSLKNLDGMVFTVEKVQYKELLNNCMKDLIEMEEYELCAEIKKILEGKKRGRKPKEEVL